jgi:hypothetical protein
MKSILKQIGTTTLVILLYIIPLVSWIIFVPFFKLLNYVTKKLGFEPPGRWKWLRVEVDEY